MHPAVGALGGAGGLLVLVVLEEDTGAAKQHLAAVGDLDFDVGPGPADAVGVDLAIRLQGDVDAGLDLTIKLLQVDAERAIEAKQLRADGFAGGIGDAGARKAHAVPERGINQQIAEPIAEPVGGAHGLTVEDVLTTTL